MEKAPGIDPKRLVLVFFVFAAIVVGLFLERLLGVAFSSMRIADPAVFGEDWTLTTVLGYGVAIVAAVVVWRSSRTQQLGLEVAGELKKVTWPSGRETRAATVAVVVATFTAAVILGLFDFVWARLAALVY